MSNKTVVTIVGNEEMNEIFHRAGVWHKTDAMLAPDVFLYSMYKEDMNHIDKVFDLFDAHQGTDAFYLYADGSTMDDRPTTEFTVWGQQMIGWIDDTKEPEFEEDGSEIMPDLEYDSLYDYMADELGVSMWSNRIAVAADLAKLNNLTVSQLFCKYTDAMAMKGNVE